MSALLAAAAAHAAASTSAPPAPFAPPQPPPLPSPPAPLPPGNARFLYPLDAPSPSVADGLTPPEEAAAHRNSVEFIDSFAGVFVPAPEERSRKVLGTALLAYHRFFARRSTGSWWPRRP